MNAEALASTLKLAQDRGLSVADLLAVAERLTKTGQAQQVQDLYKIWLEHNGDNPLAHAIWFNYGVMLSSANDLQGAKTALSEALKVKPDFLPPQINLGLVLHRLGTPVEALAQWYEVVNKLAIVSRDSISYKTTAYKHIGRVLEEARIDGNAEDVLRQSLDLEPDQRDVLEHYIMLRQKQCKWPIILPAASTSRQHLLDNISALSLASYSDDPMLQFANAAIYAKKLIGYPKTSFVEKADAQARAKKDGRLKIGYLSSDMREHAIGFLTAEMFELHDRKKVEVFLYYCGIAHEDPIKARIRGSVEHWLDISGLSDEVAAQRMLDDGIDILVDVNGNTLSARMKIMPLRPAPIIVNWLGFPGTTGTGYHNYIVADDFIVPPGSEIFYSEKVMRLPCYQPNDRKRNVSSVQPTRQENELPEGAMVYCCFNGTQKITPHVWRRWMSILKQVPDSVLWLLESVEGVRAQLRELAKEQGVAAERIFFAPRKHVSEHLARYPLADLFLDTSPYGAHTTSSDALWMGVPVLTLPGRSFASRVCGSLVKSAGLDELICTTPEQYVALAVELGKDRKKLADLRAKLKANRDKCVLFDTPLLTSRLEALYAEMWKEFKAGKLPRPDLSNIEIYNDIGVEIDRDDVELLTVPNYLDLYRQALAAKDRECFIPPDKRLWPATSKAKR
jgi:predicted O-linked N-acetylglucosamine transferase (SPINDLY family)